MKIYNNSFIKCKYDESKLSLRQLVQKTKEVDPEGRGLTVSTCQRFLREGYSPEPFRHLSIMSEVLGVSPRSSFTEDE